MLLTSQPLQTTDSVGVLQQIIAKQGQRSVSYDEAKEVGDSLIQFFQVLAEANDEPEA